MIVRIARFNALSSEGREWATEALRGVRSAYHASQRGSPSYISASIFDDETALKAGQEAIAQRLVALEKERHGPDEVEIYEVDDYIENL